MTDEQREACIERNYQKFISSKTSVRRRYYLYVIRLLVRNRSKAQVKRMESQF